MMMMNVSHAAHKIKKMSKEQTPIDALNMLRALVESNEEHHDYRISTEAVKLCLDEIEEALTKEKEQREELIKQAFTDGANWELYGSDLTQEERAEQYYNEVIKTKHLNK